MYSEEKSSAPKPLKKSYPPGVLFTFDDDYIDDWYEADQLLHPYNWKGTFFVCWYASLDKEKKSKLHYLQDRGHEIAGHGYNHLNALKYSKEFGIEKYINDDILPLKAAMKKDGFDIHTFAYPDGARDAALDTELLKHFDIIRGTTYEEIRPESQFCYYDDSRVVYGLGIDDDYKQFNIPYYKSLMDYAKAHNKIVIFYGHKTVSNADEKLETPLSALEDLCKYAKNKGLKFYTMDELAKL
ncbi:polysaccharide deacetylase family protein [Flavobacterium daemonense]|uniref:polysaccharide deacetylase family protein n=1 Tax=Flavobacterium daemonense TaxID=1393049 RepID=UPI0013A680D7|nr:polysaccharide deacetylase family protein [Flavobacterium daemonense]KAF2336953.1 polysaccharide deacetylase family protein [Flavobacterium daemonense]